MISNRVGGILLLDFRTANTPHFVLRVRTPQELTRALKD